MTKDRARKRAARDRAATTGERYVVARREAVEPPSPSAGTLHRLTHRVLGVPEHVDGGLQERAPRVRRTDPLHHGRTTHGEPRVLVGWQNRIARLFSAE